MTAPAHLRSPVRPDPPPATADDLVAAERIRDGRWCYIGEEYALGTPPPWRHDPSADKEWRIAQHKHYFAPQLLHALLATGDREYFVIWRQLLDSWLSDMGTGEDIGSDAQVEALRLRNWVTAHLLLDRARAAGLLDPDDVDDDLLRRWVERMGAEAAHVATHLKAARNHRTFQLYSVFLVALCFPEVGDRGELLAGAVEGLTANLLSDLLPDGVQVEMSSHYHQLVAEVAVDFADLAGRNGIALLPELLERVHRAARWSMWLTWPDGSIPLIGDSDDGDHRQLLATAARLFDDPELLWAATRGTAGRPPAARSVDLPDAGFVVLTDGWGSDGDSYARRTHVLYDAARLGDGAHAHYDLFSFTLFAAGRPAIVDPGRFTYAGEPDADGVDWRHTFKSTAAHNTVVVDGRDQTRHVSRNKHGPAVEVLDRRVHLGRFGDWVVAGARSAEYGPVHTRLAVFAGGEYLLLVDRITPSDQDEHRAEAALHLPAGATPRLLQRAEHVELRAAPAGIVAWTGGGVQARIDTGWVSTRYGHKEPAPVLRTSTVGTGELLLVTAVVPPGPGRPRVRGIRRLPGATPGFAVSVGSGRGRWTDAVWVSPAGFGVEGLRVDGRFAVVRRDSAGSVRWVIGEAVCAVDLPGVPPVHGPAVDLEWTAS